MEENFYEQLIKNIHRRRILYDKQHQLYHNQIEKERAWAAVGEDCGKTGEECKSRWKLLRERFCKELKKSERSAEGGDCLRSKWYYFGSLQFLREFVVKRRPKGSGGKRSPADYEDYDHLLMPLQTKIAKRIKLCPPSPASLPPQTPATSSPTSPAPTPTTPPLPHKMQQMTQIYESLDAALQKINYTLEQISATPANSGAYSTLAAMDELLRDVPEDLKDSFLLETFRRLMEVRAIARSRSAAVTDMNISHCFN